MLDLLIAGDHKACRKFWREHAPNMPQPADDEEAEVMMHMARTQSEIPVALRCWSHRWLQERNLPSMLPEDLKAKADRLTVVNAYSVGISISSDNPYLRDPLMQVSAMVSAKIEDYFSGLRKNVAPNNNRLAYIIRDAREHGMRRIFGANSDNHR